MTLPFLLQILLIGVDEFYCHHQRKLPRWERIGHSLDTITVLACLGWLLWVPPTKLNVEIYVGLSLFSSVFILKDENVHYRECGELERWLHTFALSLHPIVLMSGGFLWPALHSTTTHIFPELEYQGLPICW